MRSLVLLALSAVALSSGYASMVLAQNSAAAALPEAPEPQSDVPTVSRSAPCHSPARVNGTGPEVDTGAQNREPCPRVPGAPNPYRRFMDSTIPVPLTPLQKGKLAIHNLKDPGNLATIVGTSALTIATNSHTAYGPGMKAWGELSGYSFVQDATGEFFGTFLIPSIAHQDPHYHRMPHAKFPRRVLHVLARTVVAQSDDGKLMINYANLLTNPICAEITNLYVPGVHTNGPSTVDRILVGYANDPVGNGIAEFLPDIASHIHIRVIFVQKILNQIAGAQYPFTKPPQPPAGP